MQIIVHRINRVKTNGETKGLNEVGNEYGIEFDIRYHHDDLVLHHDPFGHQKEKLDKFEALLSEYVKEHTGTMILNVKTEGVEKKCIELMQKYNYKNWFFLDLSMPFFAIYTEKAYRGEINGFTPENLAVRFSEREPIEYALAFKDKAKWVWVDCFTKMPLNKTNYKQLKNAGFKICLVAPELQKHDIAKTKEFQNILDGEGIELDAVCTKKPELWEKWDNKK
jgi:hypothetical protein